MLGRRELDGLEQPVPELGVLPAEDFVLPDQFLSGGSAAVLGLDGGQDLLGMVADTLAAIAGLLGLRGDGAAGADEASGGIGDPTHEGYGTHGNGPLVDAAESKTASMRSIPPQIKRGLAESCQVST